MSELGVSAAHDSGAPPTASTGFPWHTAAGLAAAYTLGVYSWHWSAVLVVFWLVSFKAGCIQRRLWAEYREAAAQRAARRRDAESAVWLNQVIRAVWPWFANDIAGYCKEKLLDPMMRMYLPQSLNNDVRRPRIERGIFTAAALPAC